MNFETRILFINQNNRTNMITTTSIIDSPKKAQEDDLLGIDRYKSGLVRFVESSNTPITIALQGEWGSGKTSLMNTLKEELCDKQNTNFLPVWVNTWHYSLMKDAESAIISIIKGLSEEIVATCPDTKNKVISTFSRVFKFGARMGVQALTGNDIGDSLDSLGNNNKEVTILELRNELNSTIKDILKIKGKKGFIFFIDDLDRIDPPIAVQILELLKNIFDLESCVFVLAIDYDVVIKGLEPKFGKFSEKNEREFRSFFDKIIQLPFSMPVATYNINDFLIKSLKDIGYLTQEQEENEDFIASLSELTRLSVGTNPRSLKRLLNSLSLINCVTQSEDSEEKGNEEEKNNKTILVNYAVVNIQIAFPQIYSLLLRRPDFTKWDEKFAMELNLATLENETIEKLSKQNEFDEEWETLLYRFCEKDFYLKSRVILISQFFNAIRSFVEENNNIGDLIEQALSNSSVTSVAAFDKPVTAFNSSFLLKQLNGLLLPLLNKALSEKSKVVCNQKRFEKHLTINFDKTNKAFDNWCRFTPIATTQGIKILFYCERGVLLTSSNDFQKDFNQSEIKTVISRINSTIDEYCSKVTFIKRSNTKVEDAVWKYKDRWVVPIRFEMIIKNSEEIKKQELLNELVDTIVLMYEQLHILNELAIEHVLSKQ
jgi:hypothetical protein